MENGDTVVVEINHSGCTARIFETYTFTKEKDKLHLTTFSGIDSYNKINGQTLKTHYTVKQKDSLSFDNYFKYLKEKNAIPESNSRPIATINYKNKFQTIRFYSSDLRDKSEKLDKLMLVRDNIYPNDNFFKIPEPVPSIK